MSTTCMIVASMMENVIMPRCGTVGVLIVGFVPMAREQRRGNASAVARVRSVDRIGYRFVAEAQETRQRALVTGIDLDDRAHAAAERRPVLGVIDGNPNGDTLDHLDPVAGCVLRRNHRELGACGLADAFDAAVPQ